MIKPKWVSRRPNRPNKRYKGIALAIGGNIRVDSIQKAISSLPLIRNLVRAKAAKEPRNKHVTVETELITKLLTRYF